jgi:hypothetical protein
MKKTIIGAIAGLGLVLAVAVPSFAAGTCSDGATGANSWNVCVKASLKLNRVSTLNTGFVTQTVNSRANTGKNESNKNTLATDPGIIDPTGNATISGLKGVQLNDAAITVDQSKAAPCTDCTDAGGFKITGNNSKNISALLDVKLASVTTTNFGVVTQTVTSNANTGKNESNGNTVGGSINTGNALVNEDVTTMMNTTTVVVNQ